MDQSVRVQMLEGASEREGDLHALGNGQRAAGAEVVLQRTRAVISNQ